jgi:hypothetical protein
MTWDQSALPRDIVRALDVPKTLAELSAEFGVTDARILWYLGRLQTAGRVSTMDDRWSRTAAGEQYCAGPLDLGNDHTILPGRTVYDFRQALADSAAGMFGSEFVQAGGEHGGRLSHDQAVEFHGRLAALIAEYFAPGRADRSGTKYGFHWVFTPTDLHPLDDV